MLAAFLTALGFTLALIGELALRVLGEEVTALVISIHEKPDGKVYSRSAHYTYTAPGQPQRSDQSRIPSRLSHPTPSLVTAAAAIAAAGAAAAALGLRLAWDIGVGRVL